MHGEKKSISENRNMWGMLTAETFTPFMELDFIGSDAPALLGKTQEEVRIVDGRL